MSCSSHSSKPPSGQAGDRPIGVFDSGVGGLTVLRAIREALPAEDLIYLGDTARLPYGTKSSGTVQRYAINAAEQLVAQGIKLLVVACNTASSYALENVARAVAPTPVVGVVEPGVAAALATGARRIVVLGTEGTIRSEAYQRALSAADPTVQVESVACTLFVPLAEEGWGDHPVTDQIAEHYLRGALERRPEAMILGCTHYPLLLPSLERVVGPSIQLVDSATSVARAVTGLDQWPRTPGSEHSGRVLIQLTDASDRFRRIAPAILGERLQQLELVHLEPATRPPS
jgi:glutamate racemase